MQFFIIHDDPKINADQLPEYAIKKVNVREGYQIISDIGHNLNITWEGQNKPYSIWHAETRRFMINKESLIYLHKHYKACLDKYIEITGKKTIFHQKNSLIPWNELAKALPEKRTHAEFMKEYLLRAKTKHLTQIDINRLTLDNYSI